MKSTTLLTIDGCDVKLNADFSLEWTDDAAIDTDGIGPLHGDPCAQRQTTLKVNGQYLNADLDRYIVVPPQVRDAVAPAVIGCGGYVEYNGKRTNVVVGDIGPRKKIGEVSVATAKALGIPWSPTTGGTSSKTVRYVIFPGNIAAPAYFRTPFVKSPPPYVPPVEAVTPPKPISTPWWKFWS